MYKPVFVKINILLFGIVSDLLQNTSLEFEIPENCTVNNFKVLLQKEHQKLNQLHTYAIAVNETYATDDLVLKHNDIVAIIPPVSGG